jgi:hypothetical protein
MSIIEMPKWAKRRMQEDYDRSDTRPYKIPEDMMHELDEALADERGRPPLGTPSRLPRTAQTISFEIERLRDELTHARELVKQGEAKEATLVAELTKAVDEEIAAKKATHDADVAELESLRPATGETA